MAQKKVSVRLVAEGGRQVRAEFQGVGDAGEASFKRIERQADVTGAVLRRLAGIVAGALSVRQVVQYADGLAREKWRAPTEEPGGVLWETGTDRRRSFGVKRCCWH